MPLMVSRKPQRTFTLEWRTGGGTATAGRDFVSVPRKSVKVSKARTVQVKVQGDGQAEQTEWFRVSSPASAAMPSKRRPRVA